jgi:ABC-2 type transport system permease protein
MSNLTFEAGSVAQEQRSALYWALSDSLVLIQRSLRHIVRNLEQMLYVAVLPINILLLFRYVFGGAINIGEITYADYVIAGVLVQSMTINAASTAVSVCSDIQLGIIGRFRSMPMLSSAVLTGHVVATLARNLLSVAIIVAVGLLVGFRPTATIWEWGAILGLAMLFSLALAWGSTIIGLLVSSVEAASGFTFVFIFLPYLSSAFVPTAHMPAILRVFAENQPITLVVETLRALTIGTHLGSQGIWAVAWCGGIAAVSYVVAVWLFQRKVMRG